METVRSYLEALGTGKMDSVLKTLYGPDSVPAQIQRYTSLARRMEEWGGNRKAVFVSIPGRTELGGNHTDHNNGVVLAASITFDCLAMAVPSAKDVIRIQSEGFSSPFEVALDDLSSRKEEAGSPVALVRGVAAGLHKAGYTIGGFDAIVSGEVPVGTGLSSSASFEVCMGQILNQLFNAGTIPPLELARIGRHAENEYFHKPCGFMDQIACAVQGVLSIDFMEENYPAIQQLCVDFSNTGYQLAIVDTGGNHVDLTEDYAAIPAEIRRAAQVLGQRVARGLTISDVLASAARIRKEAGGRALVRLLHFIEESDRATMQADALREGDFLRFLQMVNSSSDSSWRLLQNCVSANYAEEQPVIVALALSERFLQGKGACRIQGGGFAGAIQAYVPVNRFADYKAFMETIFGANSVVAINIRKPYNKLILPDWSGEKE